MKGQFRVSSSPTVFPPPSGQRNDSPIYFMASSFRLDFEGGFAVQIDMVQLNAVNSRVYC